MFNAGGSIANHEEGGWVDGFLVNKLAWRPDDWPKAGEKIEWAGKFRQGMHMPRWASRITLIVTDVRMQRLQEISSGDATAEGVGQDSDGWHDYQMPGTQCCANARASFRTLWDSLNAVRGYGWDANPWVAAYTFRPILGNIDQVRP